MRTITRLCAFAILMAGAMPVFAADAPEWLWQIGKPDGDDRELALAPAGYEAYPGDPVFVVGVSDPAKDWPYVHPGPTDPWAGEVSHAFTILFGLRKAPDAGGRLAVALVDTHAKSPPTLKITVNGTAFEKVMPAGAGDASVFGQPAKGRPHRFEVDVPAGLLKAGDNEIRISTESGSWILYDWLGLRAPGAEAAPVSEAGRTAAARAAAPRRGVDQVVVVFKTHFDIGYTDMAANVVQRYRTKMIDDALKVVEKSRDLPPDRQFAWTLPGWPLSKILEDWPGQSPERREKVGRAFKDGRFVVHALPFSTHTELLETEDLVRGLGCASRLSREAGLPLPRDAKMTDVAAHAWLVPTLLRRAGVDFLHLGCNAACRSPQVPVLFWWEGPDGSRLLTMYTAENYGTGLVPPKGWPHKTWLALIHTGDNHGPPTPDEVSKLYAEAEKKLPGVKVRIGRLSDFGDAILAEKPELPVVRTDMPDTWIHGPMCDPAGAATARAIRPRIGAAEVLDTQLAAWAGKRPVPIPELAAAREQSLLYGEHTWGGALYWVTRYAAGQVKFPYGDAWKADREKGRFKRLEESWAEHTAYIEKARDLALPVLDRSLKSLAAAVGPDGLRVVVYNPLPWLRDGLVEIPDGLPGGVSGLKEPVKTVKVSGVERRGGTARFLARVNSMGYVTLIPVKADPGPGGLRVDEAAATIEGPFFKAVLDPARGSVRSLIDRKTGRELVDASSEHGFGRYLYERFDADQVSAFVKSYVKINADWALNEIGKPTMPPASEKPGLAAGPTSCSVSFDCSPLSATAAMTAAPGAGIPHPVTTRVTVYQDLPCVDFEITLKDKPADPWPEAGWLCFPFKVESPQFRVGRQNSIIDPARDIIAGSNRHLYGVTSGVAIHDPQGRGVGLCAPDSPLMSLDSPGVMKFSMDFVPKRPAVYVNLFNNHWTTNFRMWNEGTWTARVRIWSFEAYDPESSLITPSWEARVPLMAVVADGAGGTMPVQEGIRPLRRGVLVEAFGANPDGDGTLLRLWEQVGKGGPCQVTLPKGMPVATAQPCDLRGQPLGAAIPVRDGAFDAALEPFAPASFLLK